MGTKVLGAGGPVYKRPGIGTDTGSQLLDGPENPKPRKGDNRKNRQRVPTLLLLLFALVTVAICYWASVPFGLHKVVSAGLNESDSVKGRGQRRNTLEAANRLLLATHNRLLWFSIQTGEVQVLHEGQGVYYGMFPGKVNANGDLETLWVVSRPNAWRSETSTEYLAEIDADTGKLLQRKPIASRFTHDAVRSGDRVYVADTGKGEVVILGFPTMEEVGRMRLFTLREHLNTLAPLENGTLWTILHNLGQSQLVKVDLETKQILQRHPDVGLKAHGLVQWRGQFIVLDSDNARLVSVDPETGHPTPLCEVGNKDEFLKGLAVVNNIAFFGVSLKGSRTERADPTRDGELAAVDLLTNQLLWKRSVPTHGLLNIVGAPHLGEDSTYRAMFTADHGVTQDAATPHDIQQVTAEMVEKPPVGGHWQSGFPYMRLDIMRTTPLKAGLQLNLTEVDVTDLLHTVQSFPDEMWTDASQQKENAFFSNRNSLLHLLKPGVDAMYFIFSDNRGEDVYWFPYFERFKSLLLPIVQRVLGTEGLDHIVRLQLARMKPGARIKPHRDSGGYAKFAHRIHVPLVVPDGAVFEVCKDKKEFCDPIALRRGHVFEINNLLRHKVANTAASARIHLIMDVSETPKQHSSLEVGTVCNYVQGQVVC